MNENYIDPRTLAALPGILSSLRAVVSADADYQHAAFNGDVVALAQADEQRRAAVNMCKSALAKL